MGLRFSRSRRFKKILDDSNKPRANSNTHSKKAILEALDKMKEEAEAIKEIVKPNTVRVQIS